MEWFLSEVCSPDWNARTDVGLPFDEAIAELSARFPGNTDLIAAYRDRWDEILGGPVDESVDLLEELKENGTGLFALSNWSSETFPIALARFPFLCAFDGVMIPGEVGCAKPSRGIFIAFLERFDLEAPRCVFIDDNPENVASSAHVGFDAVRFESADHLRSELRRRRLLP